MLDDGSFEELGTASGRSLLLQVVAPVASLLVVVGIISALVLTGMVQGDESLRPPMEPASTVPTIQIVP